MKYTKTDQSGFVSLVVGLILVLVLALITIGFAQLSRREQQQALTKHLSLQAYYAAETGINDAKRAIEAKTLNDGVAGTDGSQCIDIPGYSGIIDAASSTSYSCAFVDLKPKQLSYDVEQGKGKYTVFKTSAPLGTLKIHWYSKNNIKTFKSATTDGFADTDHWDSIGVVEISITPIQHNFKRADLTNALFTAYLYPSSSSAESSDIAYADAGTQPGKQGPIVSGNCTAAADCNTSISGIVTSNIDNYLIHIQVKYDDTHIDLTGDDGSGSQINFIDGQAKIDVTGRAQDVLKRIRVTIPRDDIYKLPNHSLEVGNLCKRLETEPGGTTFIYPDGTPVSSSPSPATPCKLDD